MYAIYKLTSHSAVDYAAEELKKYLRMMMTDCGEIKVSYDPTAVDGFRLGLMQELGLDVSDVEDPELDDILYIETDKTGGVIAGDNPRSVLLAVYEYLRRQGCRWLFPGVDGEFIPRIEELAPTSLRHVPTCRFRGQCNEGAEFQSNMLDAIDFTPKVGMNVFMMEFRIPTSYYKRYYMHDHNEMNRPPEPVSNETILQWKIQCETELARRGLQFHDMGHGWTVDPFGIDSSLRKNDGDNELRVPPESRQFLALYEGSRKLARNTPNYTQFCMSNSVAREKIVKYAADYAEKHTNVDYLHIWLGDAVNKHCECDACRKKTPSDWYMILLNELDEELTRRRLNTRIVFIAYTDTLWAPQTERLKNSKRFTLLFAPISRSYQIPLTGESNGRKPTPYVRNQAVMPQSPEETFAYFDEWKKIWKGYNVAYEYHFWRSQYYDVGNIRLATVVNEDVRAYKKAGVNGIIQDGSQRSFFPTGYLFYTYARTLFDASLTADQLAEEYFSCAFGQNWRKFYDYLKALSDTFHFSYMAGEASADPSRSNFYNPAIVKDLKKVKDVVSAGRALIKEHYNMPFRVQTVSVRLLEMHARYAELLADALIPKAQGDDDEADRLYAIMKNECGKYEVYFQTCYDHGLAFYSLDYIFGTRTQSNEPVIY